MKRFFAVALTLAVLFTCCCETVLALDVYDTRASYTLSAYLANLYTSKNKGEVYVHYEVESSKIADSIGVKSITFYKSNGDYVTTIYGSASNGLIDTDAIGNAGDYYYALTPGVSYYAEVTVFAKIGSRSDSKTITTSTVRVP